jgi:site-specific recombinase XerD
VDAIDNEVIRDWVDQKLTQGNSVRTVARKLATVKSLFRFLYEENCIAENPADKLKLPRIRKQPPGALSQDEIRQLLNAPDPEDRNFLLARAILVVMYSCGLRVSEAANLHIEHVNLERQHLRVPGKGSKQRIIPLQDSVKSILLDYILHREKTMPETMGAGHALFMKQGKEGPVPMNVRRIQYLVEKNGRDAGLLAHAHPHLLRHSLATHLIEQGANVEAVRQTLGHEDLATTSIYIKASSKFLMDEHKKFNPTDNLL